VRHRPLQVSLVATIQEVAALEVEVVGLAMLGATAQQARALRVEKLDLEALDDGQGDLVLDDEDVVGVTNRPSSSTSWELTRVFAACRETIWMSRAEVWITFNPGTERSRSP
jgi:hypothetical protein